MIDEFDEKVIFFSTESLRDYLRDKDREIDFINFCQEYINQLRKENLNGTADNHPTVPNNLKDYFKKDAVSTNEINSKAPILPLRKS